MPLAEMLHTVHSARCSERASDSAARKLRSKWPAPVSAL